MQKILQDGYVNAWILRRDLQALAEDAAPELAPFVQAILENETYPVDSLVISPAARFVAHQPANDLIGEGDMEGSYLSFLRRARAALLREEE